MGLRSSLFTFIAKDQGLAVLQGPRNLVQRLNRTLGSPLATAEELERRKAQRARFEALRHSNAHTEASGTTATLQAPITVYFERDRGMQERKRIEELLSSEGLTFTLLDLQDDESMRSFVCTQAKVDLDRLPVVFVAEHPIGTFPAIVDAQVSGALRKLAFPSH